MSYTKKVKFKPKEYENYTRKLGLYRIKDLHSLLEKIAAEIPVDFSDINEDVTFEFEGMRCYIDILRDKHGRIIEKFCQCDLIGTSTLPLEQRIKLHEKKLKSYTKKRVLQWKLLLQNDGSENDYLEN